MTPPTREIHRWPVVVASVVLLVLMFGCGRWLLDSLADEALDDGIAGSAAVTSGATTVSRWGLSDKTYLYFIDHRGTRRTASVLIQGTTQDMFHDVPIRYMPDDPTRVEIVGLRPSARTPVALFAMLAVSLLTLWLTALRRTASARRVALIVITLGWVVLLAGVYWPKHFHLPSG
jgi:hypothetical protein